MIYISKYTHWASWYNQSWYFSWYPNWDTPMSEGMRWSGSGFTVQIYLNLTLFDRHNSSHLNLSRGVSQGSILGLLQLIIYVNWYWVFFSSDFFEFSIFADDTNWLASHSDPFKLISIANMELTNISTLLNANELTQC